MKIPHYLALTAQQFQKRSLPPGPYAWMSCHFSLWDGGIANLPTSLPPGSLLILDDQTPPSGQNIERIVETVTACIRQRECCGLLLDFQRPGDSQTAVIAKALTEALPCPVCVSDVYAVGLNCPVFLPPPPLTRNLREHLAPWEGREIWLETAEENLCYSIAKDGCRITDHDGSGAFPHRDTALHTSYRMAWEDEKAVFYLRRSREDQSLLLEEAAKLGVTAAVGVYAPENS